MTAQDKELERITRKLGEVPDEGGAMERVRKRIEEPRPRRWRLAAALTAAGVVVVLAVVAVVLVRLQFSGPGVVYGPVVLVGGAESGGAGNARYFVRGEKTDVRGGDTVVARGIAKIAVLQTSTVLLERDETGTNVKLDLGDARFDVEPLQEGQRFSVRTPHAEIRVKGTVFQVTVSAERTRLAVTKGEVEFLSGGRTGIVRAGESASSAPPAAVTSSNAPAAAPAAAPTDSNKPSTGDASPEVAAERKIALRSPAKKPGNGAAKLPEGPSKKAVDEVQELLGERKYDAAVARLESAYFASGSPEEREDLLFMKGQIQLLNLGRFRDATGTFGAYLREFPAGTYVQEAIFHVAEAYGRLDDFENASRWFERFVEESRDDGRRSAARYNVGALALRLKNDCEEALKWFGLALIAPPPDVEKKALSGAVGCHVRLGRAEGLRPLVDRLSGISPADPALAPAREIIGP